MTAFFIFLTRFWRILSRQRLFLLLNVGGLSLGLGCCLLVALFVWREASYDTQYARADDIYLAMETWQLPIGPVSLGEFSSMQLATALLGMAQGVEGVGRYQSPLSGMYFSSEKMAADELSVHFIDPEILRIFDFEWLAGAPEAAFTTPDEVVLTRELAEKYFGSVDVEGRVLTVNGDTAVRISGVVDKPASTVLDFAALLPMALRERWARDAGNSGIDASRVHTFVLLKSEANLARFEAELRELPEQQAEFLNTFHPSAPLVSVDLLPLTHIYQGRYFQSNEDGLSNGQRMQVFAAIGTCVLLIAVMNYMNLSTSRYSERALAVGVSLALGSGQTVLIMRFLSETFLVTAVAMLIGLMWVEMLLPVLNAFVGTELALADVPPLMLGTLLLLGTVLVSLLAGAYPAFYLSHADPSRILRGDLTRGRAAQRVREGLVVVQFSSAVCLLIVAAVMHGQVRHLQTLERGFDAKDVVTFELPAAQYFNLAGQWDGFAARLRQIPGVIDVALGIDSPLGNYAIGGRAVAGDIEATLSLIPILPNYLRFYGIELLAGRQFMEDSLADATHFGMTDAGGGRAPAGALLLSASAVRMLGWTHDEALGQVLTVNGWGMSGGTVVGVVEDTIGNSNQEKRALMYLVPDTMGFVINNGTASLKSAPGQLAGIQPNLRALWDEYFPDLPMPVVSLEDRIQADFRQEANQQRFFSAAALVSVLIAGLGLYGVATFNAEHRTREIGIRKVVGSSVWQIVLLLTRDFSRLVLVANVIAWPLAWVVMQRWLEQFAYRIDLTPMIFIGSGLIALCVAWVTVGGTAARAASRKPVVALRYE